MKVTVHGSAENGRGIAIPAAAPWSPPPQPWMEIHGRHSVTVNHHAS